MKRMPPIAMLLLLAGCETMGLGGGQDFHAIVDCAKQHPPPPQANVDQLGLMPVYLTKSGDVHDPAVKQWFADMDSCTAKYQAAEAKK